MLIKTENARFTIEIDEATINDFINRYIPEALLTIGQAGEITFAGKYGVLPFKIIVIAIKHDEKEICLVLSSMIKSTILTTIFKVLKVGDFLKTNLLKKELIFDVEALIKPFINEKITFEPVIENCFTEEGKIIINTKVSGEYTLPGTENKNQHPGSSHYNEKL